MKAKKKKFLLAGIIILLIGGGIMYYYRTHYVSVTFHKYPYPEITGNLNRPECGWYQLYSYHLSPDTRIPEDKLYVTISDDAGYSYRLALLEFNLSAYAGMELDPVAKANITEVFNTFATTKMKLIVRFLYDWDGNGMEHEPDKMVYVKTHMEQVSEILNDYKELIYTTQGIFIGSWAEMHGSRYLSTENITSLLLTYAEYTDDSIYLSVRTPTQYRTILEELTAHPEKYGNYHVTPEELKKRLGLFNDGLLGSLSDLGSYQEVDAATDSEKESVRQEILDFQGELCLQVPNGGEVVNNSSLNDGAAAVKDFSSMHISYLNQVYDLEVINKWKQTIITEERDLYEGKSYYDYITDHLGARFVLKDCTLNYQPFQKGKAKGTLQLVNKGFSNLYTEKEFTLRLIHTETKKETTILTAKDLEENTKVRNWAPESPVSIPFSFSPLALEDGEYKLIATLTDPETDEVISFANKAYDEDSEGYLLGIITLER